jgi:hypothetical protein
LSMQLMEILFNLQHYALVIIHETWTQYAIYTEFHRQNSPCYLFTADFLQNLHKVFHCISFKCFENKQWENPKQGFNIKIKWKAQEGEQDQDGNRSGKLSHRRKKLQR